MQISKITNFHAMNSINKQQSNKKFNNNTSVSDSFNLNNNYNVLLNKSLISFCANINGFHYTQS